MARTSPSTPPTTPRIGSAQDVRVVIDLPATETARRPPCPEEVNRVTATAVDLAVSGRRVTERLLTTLTGLEPDVVDRCLDHLVTAGTLTPSGEAPHHYVFCAGRWPAHDASRPSDRSSTV